MKGTSRRSLVLAALAGLVLERTSLGVSRFEFESLLNQSEQGVYAHAGFMVGAVVIHHPGKSAVLLLARHGQPAAECSVLSWDLTTVGKPPLGQRYDLATGDDLMRLQQLANHLEKLVGVPGSDQFDKWIVAPRAQDDFLLAGYNRTKHRGAFVVGTGAPTPFSIADKVDETKFAEGIPLLPVQAQFAACGPSGWAALEADRLTWILDRDLLPLGSLFPRSMHGRNSELIYSKQKLLAAAATAPLPLHESWTDERLVEAMAGLSAKEVNQHPGLWSWIP